MLTYHKVKNFDYLYIFNDRLKVWARILWGRNYPENWRKR